MVIRGRHIVEVIELDTNWQAVEGVMGYIGESIIGPIVALGIP